MIEIYAEHGYDGMSLDDIAAKAGVSKTTIYRRWNSKLDLLADAMSDQFGRQAPEPDLGSLAADAKRFLAQTDEAMRSPFGRLTRMFIAQLNTNPQLRVAWHAQDRDYLHAGWMRIITRAKERGETSPDCDPDFCAHALTAMVLYRSMAQAETLDESWIDEVLEALLMPMTGWSPGRPIAAGA